MHTVKVSRLPLLQSVWAQPDFSIGSAADKFAWLCVTLGIRQQLIMYVYALVKYHARPLHGRSETNPVMTMYDMPQ